MIEHSSGKHATSEQLLQLSISLKTRNLLDFVKIN